MGKIIFTHNLFFMNINELYEIIQDRFPADDIKGEFTLQGNCISWSYELENDNFDYTSTIYTDDEEDDLLDFQFDSPSSEELLLESYEGDFQKLEMLLDELDETENWTISDSEIIDDTISFKIF
jgi:hypothetical protein